MSISGGLSQGITPGQTVAEGKPLSDELGLRRVFNLFLGLSIGLILLRVSPLTMFFQMIIMPRTTRNTITYKSPLITAMESLAISLMAKNRAMIRRISMEIQYHTRFMLQITSSEIR